MNGTKQSAEAVRCFIISVGERSALGRSIRRKVDVDKAEVRMSV